MRPAKLGRLDDRALGAGADGRGQHIVVNMQACVVWTLMNEQAMPILHGDYLHRTGIFTGAKWSQPQDDLSMQGRTRLLRHCGRRLLNSTKALMAWMKEAGLAPAWMIERAA